MKPGRRERMSPPATPAALPQPDLVLESPQNPRVKATMRLRDRRHRERAGQLLIEGFRELSRAVAHAHPLQAVYYCPELFLGSSEPALLAACRAAGAELLQVSPRVMERLSYRDRPDGLIAVGAKVGRALDTLVLGAVPLVVIVEAVEKPGNLGTILRSADGAGVDAVIVCDPTTDLNNPNVVRASTGCLFSLPVAEADGESALAWVRRHGLRIVAATPEAEALYWDAPLAGPLALVLGSEQLGLGPRWRAAADLAVRIPMQGEADSLNVATATTLLLYEVLRQRRPGIS